MFWIFFFFYNAGSQLCLRFFFLLFFQLINEAKRAVGGEIDRRGNPDFVKHNHLQTHGASALTDSTTTGETDEP